VPRTLSGGLLGGRLVKPFFTTGKSCFLSPGLQAEQAQLNNKPVLVPTACQPGNGYPVNYKYFLYRTILFTGTIGKVFSNILAKIICQLSEWL
jgi:hypothetical protein